MTLSVESLTVRFGEIVALQEVSCTAVPGRVTVVIGPNAAGKSTLLRACSGAVKPRSGCVRLDEKPVHEWPVKDLATRMAYVPQQSQVAAAFTAREVVALGRYALPANSAKIARAMDMTEVGDLSDRLFLELSQGQQQRVTVARALAQVERDGILILDEPMSAMDLRHMLGSMRRLKVLAREGATILIAMHDLDAARHFGDDAWLLDAGRMCPTGPAREVLRPDRLADIFRVGFEEIEGANRTKHLVALYGRPPRS